MQTSRSDEVRRSALDVVLTWGPERATPEGERLLERHPGLDAATVTDALAEAHRVMGRAEELAPGIKGVGRSTTTRRAIEQEHPWLTDDLLDRAVQQGLYSHWRDTGL